MVNRQKEILSGVKPCLAISTLTTSAPVPHNTPAEHAAPRASIGDKEFEPNQVVGLLIAYCESLFCITYNLRPPLFADHMHITAGFRMISF